MDREENEERKDMDRTDELEMIGIKTILFNAVWI